MAEIKLANSPGKPKSVFASRVCHKIAEIVFSLQWRDP